MSIRNLDAIFRPRSVALVGASNRPGSVGAVTAANLRAGGFAGPILPVNPKYAEVRGMPTFQDIASLPSVPDLAVICTPPATVPGLIAELGRRGTKGAVVITAGFRELGSEAGRALEQAMLDAARPHLLRIVGPNCLGVISTRAGLNASFAPGQARSGGIAFVAQSGAMLTTVLDWANARGLGFSHLVSLGDMADVDFGDMLDYLANDPATTAVMLYIEAITDARKFLSAARAAARLKPVVAIKAGRHGPAAQAASSHTGALAGRDEVYDAAFRRAGILRVYDLEEVFDAVETLARAPRFARDDLVIVTNGGGAGVLACDALIDAGGRLTQLTPETLTRLAGVLPQTWSKANPVDIIGDASPQRYADALEIILAAPETNAALVLNCPTAVASSTEAARSVVRVAVASKRPVLTNWLGATSANEARGLFAEAGLPSYDTPTQAVRGFMHVVRYAQGQKIIREVPRSLPSQFRADEEGARKIVAEALAGGRSWLDPAEVVSLLSCYGIPAPGCAFAATPKEAAAAAEKLGGAVALKIVSPEITHKSDIGGVALDLQDEGAVQRAAEAMQARLRQTVPAAHLDGFLVQEMIRKPGAYELIAGMAVDRQFGPFLLFGQGGTAVELIADKAIALPPLNSVLAQDLIARTRIARQFAGVRGRPPIANEALVQTLVRLSHLVCDLDEVAEIDLNPLLVDHEGVIAVDARIRIAPLAGGLKRGSRLSIRPYPEELESSVTLQGIGEAVLRPIRPEDAPALEKFITDLSPEDARLRFFTPLRSAEPAMLARLTQIDYEREMAFVLETERRPGDFLAVARLAADPDNLRAEFAVVVRSDLHHRGLGRFLMGRLVEYAKSRGIGELRAEILSENTAMLMLCRGLGFAVGSGPAPDVTTASLRLTD
jgi:acetyltransferase